jgi:hypothetical protein
LSPCDNLLSPLGALLINAEFWGFVDHQTALKMIKVTKAARTDYVAEPRDRTTAARIRY